MSDIDDVTAKACSKKIAELREQVATLTKERDSLTSTLEHMEHTRDVEQNRHRETSAAMREQLAALAEQNEKRVELIRRLYVELFHCDQQMTNTLDEEGEPLWQTGSTVRGVLRDAKEVLSLPDLASPVLNRIRAEGMREGAIVCDEAVAKWEGPWKNAANTLGGAIRARADELEKTNAL